MTVEEILQRGQALLAEWVAWLQADPDHRAIVVLAVALAVSVALHGVAVRRRRRRAAEAAVEAGAEAAIAAEAPAPEGVRALERPPQTASAPEPAARPAPAPEAAPEAAPAEPAPPAPEPEGAPPVPEVAPEPPAPVSVPEEPAPAPEAVPAPPPPPKRRPLRERLGRTQEALVGRLAGLLGGGRKVDPDVLEELEAVLFTADLGVRTAEELLERVRREAAGQDAERVRVVLRDAIAEKLRTVEPEEKGLVVRGSPHVILVLGVNGSGKTTTIGKLAARYREAGHSVILGAGDTFRAAAREQLEAWGERAGCEVVSGPDGGDPAAVAFDTVKAARTGGIEVAIVDTAGRLQTKAPLMEELGKIVRVIGRELDGAPHETLLVLDANTGQNAISQAREFTGAAGVSGLVLTKLDGTAKGGVIVGLADEFHIPVRFVGVGEGVEDLRDFDADEFVDALFA
jgi:fused signal recognition particle receptor